MPLYWFKGPVGEPFQFQCGPDGIHVPGLADKVKLKPRPLELNGVVVDFDKSSGYLSMQDAQEFIQGLGGSTETAIPVDGQPAGAAAGGTAAPAAAAAAGQEEHFNKVIDGLQAISRQLAPFEAAMQPVQVGFPANALANRLGALMATSRWRVCWAMWFQAVVFPVALFVLVYYLGSMTGVVSWVLGLGGVVVWWLGVFRDHQKDDVAFLQKHIKLVREIVSKQEAAANLLTERWGIPVGHAALDHLTVVQYKALLDDMLQREKYLCSRFHMVLAEQ